MRLAAVENDRLTAIKASRNPPKSNPSSIHLTLVKNGLALRYGSSQTTGLTRRSLMDSARGLLIVGLRRELEQARQHRFRQAGDGGGTDRETARRL